MVAPISHGIGWESTTKCFKVPDSKILLHTLQEDLNQDICISMKKLEGFGPRGFY
jgi:hypothetical protein